MNPHLALLVFRLSTFFLSRLNACSMLKQNKSRVYTYWDFSYTIFLWISRKQRNEERKKKDPVCYSKALLLYSSIPSMLSILLFFYISTTAKNKSSWEDLYTLLNFGYSLLAMVRFESFWYTRFSRIFSRIRLFIHIKKNFWLIVDEIRYIQWSYTSSSSTDFDQINWI